MLAVYCKLLFFWCPGPAITMAAPTEIVTLKTQVFVEIPYIQLSNLNFLECRKSNFAFKISVFMSNLLLL